MIDHRPFGGTCALRGYDPKKMLGNRHRPNYPGVPTVAFTLPPIAAVGLMESEARAQGLKFRLQCQKAADWYTARRVGESVYGFKVLVEEGTGRIFGTQLVVPTWTR